MVKNSPVELDPSIISAEYPGVDWCGLKRIVLADPDVPDRDEVLRIIDTPGTPDDRMPRLKKLHWGPYPGCISTTSIIRHCVHRRCRSSTSIRVRRCHAL